MNRFYGLVDELKWRLRNINRKHVLIGATACVVLTGAGVVASQTIIAPSVSENVTAQVEKEVTSQPAPTETTVAPEPVGPAPVEPDAYTPPKDVSNETSETNSGEVTPQKDGTSGLLKDPVMAKVKSSTPPTNMS